MEESITHCMIDLSIWLNMENQGKKNRGRQNQKQKMIRINKVNRLQMQQRKKGKGKGNQYLLITFYLPTLCQEF